MTDVRTFTHASIYRRLWFIILLTALILTMPIAMILLLTGDVYRKRDDQWLPIKSSTRYIYGGVLALWLVAAIFHASTQPGGIQGEWQRSAITDNTPQSQATADTSGLDTCESSDAADMVKGAIEDSATSKIIARKVLDFGHAKEDFLDKEHRVRYCEADAELNTGSTPISYKLYLGPSGTQLVEVQAGTDSYGAKAMAAQAAQAAATQAPPSAGLPVQQPANLPQHSEGRPQAQAGPGTQVGSGEQSTAAQVADDPADARLSAEYKKCMATGDAANGETDAMIKCTSDEFIVQDAKLNATYKKLMASLDPEKQVGLRNAQRAWIKFRDSKCDSESQTGGTMDQVTRPDCILQMTVKRTMELEALDERGN